jgi:hypothetical protein
MGSLGEAVLDLTADPSKLDPGLNEGKGKITGALGGLKSVFGEATGTMLGQLSAGVLRDMGQGIINVGKDITGAALEAETAQAQLNAVIESTGGAAGVTSAMANEYADALSKVTMFDDEAILGGESMLLTFTNIGQDVFPQATSTMLDMSQALGQDLNSSAMQLGKALNDPIQGVTALRRVGVQFTDDQEKMIKAMVESGDVAGAQKLILGELGKEFGGSAEAAGETMAGQLAILGTEFGNLKEEAGTAFLPVLKELVVVAKQLMPYIQQAIQWFSGLPAPVKTGVVAFLGLVAVLAPLIGIISSIISIVTVLGPAFAAIGAALSGAAAPILIIIAALALLYLAWKNNFGGMRDVINGFISIAKNLWQALLAFLRGDTTAALGFLNQAFETYVNLAKSQFERLKTFLTGIWNGLTTFLKNAWQDLWNGIVSYVQNKINEAVANVKNLVTQIKAAFTIDWSELGKRIIDGLIQGLKNGISAVAQAAMSVAQAAFDAAKNLLGIDSPSKAFAELGDFSGQGFTQGLKKSMAPENITPIMHRAVAGAGQTLSRSMQNNINIYNPKAETASGSVDRTLRKMSYLGVIK